MPNVLQEECRIYLKNYVNHFMEVHNGYLNIKTLLEDTVLHLSAGDDKQIIPFNICIDGSIQDKIIIKYGQLKQINKGYIIQGIGRKIILKYKSEPAFGDVAERIIRFKPK